MRKETINKKAERLSVKLPALTGAQTKYAIRHSCDHKALLRGGNELYCLECGCKFKPKFGKDKCPHCGTKYTVEKSRRVSWKKEIFVFNIITTKEDLQIIRSFYIHQYTCPLHPARYEIFEVSQWFTDIDGNEAAIARPRKPLSRYIDGFNYDKDMKLQRKTYYTYYGSFHGFSRYFVTGCVYPYVRLLPIVERNGAYKQLFEQCTHSPHYIIEKLLSDNTFESLVKCGRIDILNTLREDEICNFLPQIRLAVRHNYYPADFQLWTDTIRMARDLGYDTMSPKYILPKDLTAMHDLFVRKQNEQRRREEIRRCKVKKDEFLKRCSKFFGVCIVSDDIEIKPLKSYEEFVDEGEKMHHCVATYFGRPGSLILSAKENGKRLATIELDANSFDVRQCRGVCNQVPEKYDFLIDLLNRNKKVFRRAKKSA